ncbi:MAG: hypothetical protein ACXWEY_14160 [Bacteroidia bacterium]
MNNQVNYFPEVTGGGGTTLLPVTPYAHIDLENSGGAVYTVDLILNIPSGSMLDINGLQISGIMQTTCGCSYRICSLGITLASGSNVLTPISVPISSSLLTGAQLLMIEITDTDNPVTRPKGRTVIVLPGGINISI